MIKKNIAIALLLFAFSTMYGQMQIQRVEASFIANFMRYIQWPEQGSMETIKVGVYGKGTDITKELNKTIKGKNIGTAIIEVVEVTEAADLKTCQIIFIPNGKSYKAKKELKALGNAPILTITEEQDYQPDYAIINFKVVNSKLTFQLRSDLAEQKGINISSRLQQMATN